MTAYVFTPRCPIPSPVFNQTGPGFANVFIWGAGIKAGSLPIRINKIETLVTTLMDSIFGQPSNSGNIANPLMPFYRVDSAVFHGSSIDPLTVPVSVRQGATVPSCTTSIGTIVGFLSSASDSTYDWTVQGTIPSGTFNYLGACSLASVESQTSIQISPGLVINPGSAFWIGSPINPIIRTIVVNPGQTSQYTQSYPTSGSPIVGSTTIDATNLQSAVTPTNIHFDEIRLQPSR